MKSREKTAVFLIASGKLEHWHALEHACTDLVLLFLCSPFIFLGFTILGGIFAYHDM